MRFVKLPVSLVVTAIIVAATPALAHHIHPDPTERPILARLLGAGDDDAAEDDHAEGDEVAAPADPAPSPAPAPAPVNEPLGYAEQPASNGSVIDLLFEDSSPAIGSALLMMPVAVGQLTSSFGMRRHPLTGAWTLHEGIDWSAPPGTPVFASGDGIVVFAGWDGAYGNVVRIAHAAGKETTYAHLSSIRVSVGAVVVQGQTIGAVGSTGNATGPHLHYEVRIEGTLIDPLAPQVLQARAVFTEEVTLRGETAYAP